MPSKLTRFLRINSAEVLFEDVTSGSTNYYAFISRSRPWDDEQDPDAPTNAREDLLRIRDELIAMKKITSSDVSFVIPRINWDDTGNTVYFPFKSDDGDIFDHPTTAESAAADLDGTYTAGGSYVLTDEWNLYKCMDNFGESKSTEKPTGTGTSIIITADSYKWKFLYTVSDSERTKFLTTDWIPVKTLTSDDGSAQWDVQAAAVDGAIESILVTDSGSGYDDVTSGNVDSAAATTLVLATGGSITNDIYNGASVYISGPTGGGQVREITDYVGSTATLTVTPAWTTNPDNLDTYEILPAITISGNGSSATAKVTVSGGEITVIDVSAAGSGYTYATVSIPDTLGGTGAEGDIQIGPKGGHGDDPVRELGANCIMLNTRIDYTETDFIQLTGYRTVGMIKDVFDYGTTDLATASTLNANSILNVSSVSGTFSIVDNVGEEITSDGAGTPTGYIVELDTPVTQVRYVQTVDSDFTAFGTTETLTGTDSSATATIDSITNPEVDIFSGEIIFLNNREKVVRDADQLEDIKLVICF